MKNDVDNGSIIGFEMPTAQSDCLKEDARVADFYLYFHLFGDKKVDCSLICVNLDYKVNVSDDVDPWSEFSRSCSSLGNLMSLRKHELPPVSRIMLNLLVFFEASPTLAYTLYLCLVMI